MPTFLNIFPTMPLASIQSHRAWLAADVGLLRAAIRSAELAGTPLVRMPPTATLLPAAARSAVPPGTPPTDPVYVNRWRFDPLPAYPPAALETLTALLASMDAEILRLS